MTDLGAVRSQPVVAVGRVRNAWWSVPSGTQLATTSAALGSLAVGLLAPASAPIRLATAISGGVLVAAALVDIHEHRLPNALLGAAAAVTVAGAVASGEPDRFATMVLGAVLALALMLIVRSGRRLGMGDVKMAGAIGASCGAVSLLAAPAALAIGAFAAGSYGVIARRDRLPLGPSLWLGWLIAVTACGVVAP